MATALRPILPAKSDSRALGLIPFLAPLRVNSWRALYETGSANPNHQAGRAGSRQGAGGGGEGPRRARAEEGSRGLGQGAPAALGGTRARAGGPAQAPPPSLEYLNPVRTYFPHLISISVQSNGGAAFTPRAFSAISRPAPTTHRPRKPRRRKPEDYGLAADRGRRPDLPRRARGTLLRRAPLPHGLDR